MRRIEAGRSTVAGDGQIMSEVACSSERPTPSRRLEFSCDSAVVKGVTDARRAWEKDVTAFLVSQSHMSLARDPLLELKLDDSQEGVERRERGGVSSMPSPLAAGNPMEVLQQRSSRLHDDFKFEKRHLCTGEMPESKPPPCACASRAAEEEEEQVVSGRGVVYSDAGMFNPYNLNEGVTRMERDCSSPCLIPTPESHTLGPQGVSQATTDCAPTLVVREFSSCQGANTGPPRPCNAEEQQDAVAGDGCTGEALQESGDEGCGEGAVPPGDSAEGVLVLCERHDVVGRGEVGGKKQNWSLHLPSIQPKGKNGGDVEEDAPLFHRVPAVRRKAAAGAASTMDLSRTRYTEGMRVEGKWGCQWFGAVVTEQEKNGYVQIRWDADGSLLHVKLREIRPLQEKERKNGTKERNLVSSNSVMTATQLVEIMDNETPNKLSLKEELGPTPWDTVDLVNPSSLTLYLTPTAHSRLAGKVSALTKLKERGTLVVESPAQLEPSALAASAGERRPEPRMSFFVVADEDVEEDDGIMIAVAHAMGLSTISLRWLEELEIDVADECQQVRVPKLKDLIGQGSDARVRWRLLPLKEERFLSKKRVYLAGDDAEVAFLLQVCGATVTLQPPMDGDSPPHYVYVAPGRRARITPGISSVALLEKSWLLHRIHEFFLALPPPRRDSSSTGVVGNLLLAGPVSGVKRPREEEEERMETKPNLAEAVPSSTAVAVSGSSRVMASSSTEALPVLEGEDYYFRVPQVSKYKMDARRRNEAPVVELGRVVRIVGGGIVTMRIYEVKHRVLRQNPRTGCLENQTSVYLGLRAANVTVADLIFSIPVYVVDASQMQHVYVLESPPRSVDASAGSGVEGQKTQLMKTEDEEVSNWQCMDDKASLSVCPAGLSSGSVPLGVHTRSGNQESRVLKEIIVNGWQIRPGVDVWFHDHFSSAQMASSSSERRSKGRVQTIQCVAAGVVLVVHRKNSIEDADGSRVAVITPDMVTALA
ncbi:uncharacterized protein Tco025E_04578 [Trypanosoma conorhini]|uniref:Agenet domain-containing protein n=1 Tax=Trypanosoma conorhini TaxID=83891 RepID=A0A3R7KZR4_9TRYP|nr:uncharacterized protein Tco025E_04578 [Trypanosoma conorhini]RNF18266.1 hypothetical protein Tco025E_04578 [Trypanosoma conorhini]